MSKISEKNEEVMNDQDFTKYEVMILVEPNITQNKYEKHLEELKALIKSFDGSIWHEEQWGKRALAYPIKKQTYGFYVIFNFDMEPAKAQELNGQLRLLNFVMRYLLTKTPKDYAPQKYDLDRVEKREKVEVQEEPESMKKKPAQRISKPEAAKPAKKESEPKSAEKLAKLDEKLEELLSGDENFNL